MKRFGKCSDADRRSLPLLIFPVLVFSAVAFAQTKVDPITGEQMIEIQVTPADFAAKSTHNSVHTTGALRPDGTRHAPKTFTTDATGALVEVTGKPQALANAAAAAASPASTGAPLSTGRDSIPRT